MAAAAVATAAAAGGHHLPRLSRRFHHQSASSSPLARSLTISFRRCLVGSVRSSSVGTVPSTDQAPKEEEQGSEGIGGNVMLVEQPGGKMVAELVGAFNELSERMGGALATTSSSRLLFMALKLSIPLLQALPFAADGRQPLSRSLSVACLLADLQAKRLKAIMLAAAELAAIRLRDLPSANQIGGLKIEHHNRVFRLLDKNGDGRISIEELTEIMEDLGAGSKDAQELMQLLDSNCDGSLSSEEFDLFQQQVEFMRNLDEKDDQYRAMLGKKLHMSDSTGLIQVYQRELGDKLGVS